MSRTASERLRDILDAIRKIGEADGRLQIADQAGDGQTTELTFDAVLMNHVVIGESIKALSPELLAHGPDIPWHEVARMRDTIGHHYHRIEPAIIHAAVKRDLPPLSAAVTRLIAVADAR